MGRAESESNRRKCVDEDGDGAGAGRAGVAICVSKRDQYMISSCLTYTGWQGLIRRERSDGLLPHASDSQVVQFHLGSESHSAPSFWHMCM